MKTKSRKYFATEYIFNSIKYEKTVGVIEDNPNGAYMKIAEPVGIVMGLPR